MTGGSFSSGGTASPSTGGNFDSTTLDSTSDPTRVFPVDRETTSIIIQNHPDNSGRIFVGFDDTVDSSTGFVLETGDTFTIDIDVSEQQVFAVPNNANDEIRHMDID